MSSDDALLFALTTIQQNDYTSLALLSAVGYDYVLTFSEEIEYIWSKPWTWVSTLFILVRYFGLFNLVVSALEGSSFLPGPAKTYVFVLPSSSGLKSIKQFFLVYSIHGYFQGQIIGIVNGWTFLLFFGAADFVMILRVWAMYNRSRLIFGTLLALFSVGIISTILAIAIDSIPKNLPAVIIQLPEFSFCALQATAPIWTNVAVILQITQGGAMCAFAIVQVIRQSLQMYRATKQWQLNRYMGLLVKQGILSFLAIFLFNLINVLSVAGMAPTGGWKLVLLVILEYVPIYTLTPRFILNMRVLYALDIRGRRGGEIDSGFGLSSPGPHGTVMVFADAGQNGGLGDVDEIPMEVGTTRAV